MLVEPSVLVPVFVLMGITLLRLLSIIWLNTVFAVCLSLLCEESVLVLLVCTDGDYTVDTVVDSLLNRIRSLLYIMSVDFVGPVLVLLVYIVMITC